MKQSSIVPTFTTRSEEDLLNRISGLLVAAIPVGLMIPSLIPSAAIAQSISTLQPSAPAVTTVLPASTLGLLLINTTPEAWSQIDRFNPLPPEFKQAFQVPFLPPEIDFSADIQPWLGDRIALAFLPANTETDTIETSIVLLAPIKQTNQFNAFLEKLRATRGQPNIERDYKGITILQWSAPNPPIETPSLETPLEAPPEASPQSPAEESPEASETPSEEEETTPAEIVSPSPSPAPRVKAIQQKPLSEPESPEASESDLEPEDGTSNPPLEQPFPGTDAASRNLVIAVLPNNLAIATQAQALEKLIDTQTNSTTLAQNSQFLRTIRHPQFRRSLIVSYGDLAGLTKFLSPLAATAAQSPFPFPFPFPLPTSSQLEALTSTYSTADTHVWVQPEGIRSQVNFYYTTPQPDRATVAVPNPNQIVSRLPAITYLSANSRNLAKQWQAIAQTTSNNPNRQFIDNVRRFIRTFTGLNLEEDIISWMDREYALFMFPTTGGFFNAISPRLNLGLGLIIQTSDRPAAEAALKKLDQSFKTSAGKAGTVVTRRVNGQPVVSWESKDRSQSLSLLAHSWVDDDTLLITTGAPSMATLNPKPYLPLHLNYTFKTATADFPQPNEGFLYVNMGASLSFLYGLILPTVPQAYLPIVQEVQRVIGTIRSVSTSNSATAEAQRVDGLWVFGPVGERESKGVGSRGQKNFE